MSRKKVKESDARSDVALMVWLTGAPYLIMKELSIRSQSPTEVAKALGKPIAWVSKRTGRMEGLGLIIKEGPDDHGVKVMTLTKKGKRVMTAISDIRDNPLFVELERALDIKAPGDEARTQVRDIAEQVKEAMTLKKGKLDIGRLYDAALSASSMKVEDWYDSEDLTYLFSILDNEGWDEPSRLLLVRIIGRAIIDSRCDRKYVTKYNGLLGPLTQLALKKDADVNARVESIMSIRSLRDRGGKVPNSALRSMIQIQWKMFSPKQGGRDLIEDAISLTLKSWAPLLSEDQRELLLWSVGQMRCGRMPFKKGQNDDDQEAERTIDEAGLQRYRALSGVITGRSPGESSG